MRRPTDRAGASAWERYDEAFADRRSRRRRRPRRRAGTAIACTVMIDKARCGIARADFPDGINAQRIGNGVHYLSIPERP